MERLRLKTYKNLPVQLKATFAFFICSLLQKGISVLTTPIFTRILTSDSYGRFSTFNSWYEILISIVSLSLVGGVYTTAMVKFEDDKKILSSAAQGLILLSCTIWLVIYLIFANFWNGLFKLTTIQMISMSCLILTSTSFGLWAIEQRVSYNYKQLVSITIIVSILKPIVGIILVKSSEDQVTARILGILIVEITCYLWIIFYQIIRGKKVFSKKYWLYFICYSLPLIPHSISQAVLNSSDRIMIQNLIGQKEAGYYNLAYSVSLIMIILNTSLSQTLAPWTYQKLKERKEDDLNRIMVSSCIIIAIMNLLLILLAPEIISFFAPKEYSQAVYVIPPVVMSVFFMYLYDWFVRIEYYFEKTHYVLIASISGAVINIVLNFLLLPSFGYLVAGYTTLISFAVYAILHYYFMRKICRQKMNGKHIYNEKHLLLIIVIFLAIGIGLSFLYSYWYIRYIILSIIIIIALIKKNTILIFIKELLNLKNKKEVIQ